ncbi:MULTISPECIES: hypothetical protein [unclassified Ensifer]|nr:MULTISPECIES: hypothetical protein [unclassified Ensifer]
MTKFATHDLIGLPTAFYSDDVTAVPARSGHATTSGTSFSTKTA